MPAGAQGVTLYLARLAGASWPRSEGRVVGVSWGGRRRRRGKALAEGRRVVARGRVGEGAVRVRALEPLNARLGFGRRKAGDSSDVIVRTAVPKRAMGVLDCKRSLFRRPAVSGSCQFRSLAHPT